MFRIVCVIAAVLLLFVMLKSRHFVKAVLFSVVSGLAALFAVNFVGNFIGVHIPLNWFSALAGVLGGVPGIIFLLVCEILTLIV